MSATTSAADRTSLTPLPYWESPSRRGHSVQFYEDDSFLLEGLTRFIGAAIVAGDSAVVIATESHRKHLATLLQDRGLDLELAVKQGRFLALDAAEVLTKITTNGQPDTKLFSQLIGGVINQLASAARGEQRRVAAFGEMVALLWAGGKPEAAIQLEKLWNELSVTHEFQLHCAYPMTLFSYQNDGEAIRKVCAEHSHVVPAEHYTALGSDEERLQAILLLQQKAQALETEMFERKKAQERLQQRENELSDYLENAVIPMHWVSGDGTILWANNAELALLGYERDEYVGHHIAEFHADASVIEDILDRLSRKEELHGYEARLRRKDGAIRSVAIHSNVFRRDGQFIHTRCFTIDTTEKKHADQASSRLAAIVESAEDAIASKDLNGIITSWNKSAERIFGYKAEEIIGQSVLTLIPPELHDDEPRILAKIRAGERIEHFETVRVTKHGERLQVSLTVSPVRDQEGKIIGAAKIVRDITEQKKLEAALHTSERLASVGRLAATVAHEINNPLEAVTNFIYLAKQQPELSEKIRRYLQRADHELARVAHIAQQTLGFYRDNSRPVLLEVSDVVQDVLLVYDRKAKHKELTVESAIAPGLTVYTLQGELKQILSNLLSNAIDASKEGGRITVRAHTFSHLRSGLPGIRITIADHGVGISAEHKSKVFAPFFTTKKEVGTGLGLWITKDLLQKKGGHIRFRSRDSQPSGTVMSIYLPQAPVADSAAIVA